MTVLKKPRFLGVGDVEDTAFASTEDFVNVYDNIVGQVIPWVCLKRYSRYVCTRRTRAGRNCLIPNNGTGWRAPLLDNVRARYMECRRAQPALTVYYVVTRFWVQAQYVNEVFLNPDIGSHDPTPTPSEYTISNLSTNHHQFPLYRNRLPPQISFFYMLQM